VNSIRAESAQTFGIDIVVLHECELQQAGIELKHGFVGRMRRDESDGMVFCKTLVASVGRASTKPEGADRQQNHNDGHKELQESLRYVGRHSFRLR